jgi:hypothetical protein
MLSLSQELIPHPTGAWNTVTIFSCVILTVLMFSEMFSAFEICPQICVIRSWQISNRNLFSAAADKMGERCEEHEQCTAFLTTATCGSDGLCTCSAGYHNSSPDGRCFKDAGKFARPKMAVPRQWEMYPVVPTLIAILSSFGLPQALSCSQFLYLKMYPFVLLFILLCFKCVCV